MEINMRPECIKKPSQPMYKKSNTEAGPSWAERREFVHWLINDSNVNNGAKKYLLKQDHWCQKYQLRGF